MSVTHEVLAQLEAHGPATTAEIAQALGKSTMAVASRIHKLHDNAFIEIAEKRGLCAVWRAKRSASEIPEHGNVMRAAMKLSAAADAERRAPRREVDRDRLAADVAAFLQAGGRITKLPGPGEYNPPARANATRGRGYLE